MRLLPCLFAAIVMVSLGMAPAEGRALDREAIDPLQTLSDFKGYKYDYSLAPQGVYTFYYMLPQSSRFEERTESGEVRGNYAYVAPEGDEFKFKYEAGKKGFQVESNALPTAPEDTDEVKRAKEAFFEAYEKALAQAALEEGYGQKKGKALEGGESENEEEGDEEEGDEEEEEEEEDEEEDEDEDEEESEEDDDEEESEEDDDEESSEESSEEDDDDDEESSEEDDDEESSEESDEEDEEEESDEDVRKALNVGRRLNPTRRKSSSYEIPNYIYKKINDVPRRRRLGPRTHNPNNILNYSRNPRTRRRNAQPQSQRIRRRITTRQASSP